MKALDLTGQRFGLLVAVRRIGGPDSQWECACDCGGLAVVQRTHLRSGNTKSCGCMGRPNRRHGMWRTKIYAVWRSMRGRCKNPRAKSYANYGGRGIKVCDRWESFDNFYADVGQAPFQGASLDRINNDGDYEPGNVRWATKKQQQDNRRDTHRVPTAEGVATLTQLAERSGINKNTLRHRLAVGMSAEEAISAPVRKAPARARRSEVAP